MSFAYKVEELLALRDSVSESAVSIDNFADEDVIKEHVLRPSVSASAKLASRSSGRSLRPPPADALPVASTAPAAPHKKPSPSPSIKRGKAEKLLKEHGSPPGLRVTAGGRIVPSDLAPLGTARYPDHTFKPPTLRVAPGNIMPLQTQPNNNAAPRIEIVGGQPVIYIGDRIFALPVVNTNSGTGMENNASMDSSAKQMPEPPTSGTHGSVSGLQYGPPRANSTSPFAGLDLATLKTQQALKKQELRQVEQTEVLQASHQTETWRTSIIEKKRCLIVELDALRKSITALENDKSASIQSDSFPGSVGTMPGSVHLPTFVPQVQQPAPHPQAMYGFPSVNPYASMMMYQPSYGPFHNFPATEPVPAVLAPASLSHSPGAASRRSHAVAIKPPQEGTSKQTLNPKSPKYEPPVKPSSAQNGTPPMSSLPKQSPPRTREEPQPDRFQHQNLSHKPSLSSIDTTDFFPTNTHEHSTTRLAPSANEAALPTSEKSVVPLTPEKHWPASPWNEAHSGRSRANEPKAKLTSWPEAFGKQPSSSSLRQSTSRQTSAVVSERAPIIGSYGLDTAVSNKGPMRSESNQGNGTDENWPFSRKAVTHVPSTYQEGYQAGYDHVGMPDHPEVLQGYIQGLLQFLSDESKRGHLEGPVRDLYVHSIDSRTPSLRGLVAGSMPHDSAVSMNFDHRGIPSGELGKARSSKDSLSANTRLHSAYSPQGGTKDTSASYALFNEAAYASRQRNIAGTAYAHPASQLSERLVSGQQIAFTSSENAMSQPEQGQANASHVEVPVLNGSSTRPFSGTQLQNRGHGTPLFSQRFYPALKEMSPNSPKGGAVPTMRPFADHRLSGLDGAMDDLADVVLETPTNDQGASTGGVSNEALMAVKPEVEEETASCFKTSSGKGKQKVAGSPSKVSGSGSGYGRDGSFSSPTAPNSPKKSGEQSPAKARLEQVTNRFRRTKRDDPRTMSPEDKARRSEKWRKRFLVIKQTELEEIAEHDRNTRT